MKEALGIIGDVTMNTKGEAIPPPVDNDKYFANLPPVSRPVRAVDAHSHQWIDCMHSLHRACRRAASARRVCHLVPRPCSAQGLPVHRLPRPVLYANTAALTHCLIYAGTCALWCADGSSPSGM